MTDNAKASAVRSPTARILVVEDFQPVRLLIERLLVFEGYDVIAVTDAPEAYARSTGEQFDLIVTDVNVPGGNGLEIARAMAVAQPSLRVLVVSGEDEGDIELDVPGAHVQFLSKPFDIDMLVAQVRSLLPDPAGS